jgi:hypothetical protein
LKDVRRARHVYGAGWNPPLRRSTRVVEPTDVTVLDDTGAATLTLVTCYPFACVGGARRFIARRALDVDPVWTWLRPRRGDDTRN